MWSVQVWAMNLGTATRPDLRWVYYMPDLNGGHFGVAIVSPFNVGPNNVFVINPQPLADGTFPVKFVTGRAVNRPILGIRMPVRNDGGPIGGPNGDTIFWTTHARPEGFTIPANGNDVNNILNAVAGAPAAIAAAGRPPAPNWIIAGDMNRTPAQLTAVGAAPLPAGTRVLNSRLPTQGHGGALINELDYAVTNQAGLSADYKAIRLNTALMSDHIAVGIGRNLTP
jgi:hypothetical protein